MVAVFRTQSLAACGEKKEEGWKSKDMTSHKVRHDHRGEIFITMPIDRSAESPSSESYLYRPFQSQYEEREEKTNKKV